MPGRRAPCRSPARAGRTASSRRRRPRPGDRSCLPLAGLGPLEVREHVAVGIGEGGEALPAVVAAAFVIDRDALRLQPGRRRVQDIDREADRPAGLHRLSRSNAVQPERDRAGLELRPVVPRTEVQPEAEGRLVEGHGAVHVVDEEVDEVDRGHGSYRSIRRTATAALVLGTPRQDWTTAARPSPARSCSTAARVRARPFASWRYPSPSAPPERLTDAGSSSASPSASRCCSCLYANVSSTSAVSMSLGWTSACAKAVAAARSAATARDQSRLSTDGASWLQPMPSSHTVGRPSVRSSEARTITTHPSALRAD